LERLLGSKGGLADSSKRREVNGVDGTNENDLELDFGGLTLQELALGKTFVVEEKATYKAQTVEECMSTTPNPFTSTILIAATR
jgi:hypothetical protein